VWKPHGRSSSHMGKTIWLIMVRLDLVYIYIYVCVNYMYNLFIYRLYMYIYLSQVWWSFINLWIFIKRDGVQSTLS
jgi:hypothetical protein